MTLLLFFFFFFFKLKIDFGAKFFYKFVQENFRDSSNLKIPISAPSYPVFKMSEMSVEQKAMASRGIWVNTSYTVQLVLSNHLVLSAQLLKFQICFLLIPLLKR